MILSFHCSSTSEFGNFNVNIFYLRVVGAVESAYMPEAVVVQCGSDGLAQDPIGQFNLTHLGYGNCIRTILSWKKPTLFLGGGLFCVNNQTLIYLRKKFLLSQISPDPRGLPNVPFTSDVIFLMTIQILLVCI